MGARRYGISLRVLNSIAHVCCYGFSRGRKSLYKSAVYVTNTYIYVCVCAWVGACVCVCVCERIKEDASIAFIVGVYHSNLVFLEERPH